MESDLVSLLDYAGKGSVFPQYLNTWGGLLGEARILANRLDEKGNGKRLRIALCSNNPERFCALLLACGNRNWDIFLFNPNWSLDERSEALRIASPHWILGDFAKKYFEASQKSVIREKGKSSVEGTRVMIPTGGTSGKIRFAVHTWSTLLASVRAFQAFFEVKQISLHCTLPLYHVSGFMQLVRAIASRGEVFFGTISDFGKCHKALRPELCGSRFLSLVPTQLYRLLSGDFATLASLEKYRAVFVGGGPLSIDLLQKARELRLPLAPTYGMTETASMVATLKPVEFLEGKSGQGRALPHARFEIIETGPIESAKTGQGRIRVKSTALFLGYYGEDDRLGDWYLTSDRGELGPLGELTVLGRADRVIISGGENVDLQEIEEGILKTGLVREAAAFGMEDEEWGVRLCAACVLKDRNLEEIQLKQKVSRTLVGFKIPKTWILMDALPRNESGKVLERVLRKRLKEIKNS